MKEKVKIIADVLKTLCKNVYNSSELNFVYVLFKNFNKLRRRMQAINISLVACMVPVPMSPDIFPRERFTAVFLFRRTRWITGG